MSIVQQLVDFLQSWKLILNEVRKRNASSLVSVLSLGAFLKEDLLNREKKKKTW
jgi:hypothetical protein